MRPSDHELVRGCLNGDSEAWAALIDRYKNLIFSIPIKYGFPQDDAAEIFQQVCVELFAGLENLRRVESLPKWLIQVAAHRCFHWRRQQARFVEPDPAESGEPGMADPAPLPDEILRATEREQWLREAIAGLPPRCRQLVQMLFFESPARPYQEIARSLGIATGSIGFIRGRCLDKLRRQLETAGFA